MGIVELIATFFEILLKSGGADKLKELLNRHQLFIADVVALRAELRAPRKSKGY